MLNRQINLSQFLLACCLVLIIGGGSLGLLEQKFDAFNLEITEHETEREFEESENKNELEEQESEDFFLSGYLLSPLDLLKSFFHLQNQKFLIDGLACSDPPPESV